MALAQGRLAPGGAPRCRWSSRAPARPPAWAGCGMSGSRTTRGLPTDPQGRRLGLTVCAVGGPPQGDRFEGETHGRKSAEIAPQPDGGPSLSGLYAGGRAAAAFQKPSPPAVSVPGGRRQDAGREGLDAVRLPRRVAAAGPAQQHQARCARRRRQSGWPADCLPARRARANRHGPANQPVSPRSEAPARKREHGARVTCLSAAGRPPLSERGLRVGAGRRVEGIHHARPCDPCQATPRLASPRPD